MIMCATAMNGCSRHDDEDRTERLDIVPAQLRVIFTIRPRYACRGCTDGVTQAEAPHRLSDHVS